MAKFGNTTPDSNAPDPVPAPVAPAVTVVDVNNNNSSGATVMAQQTVQLETVAATAQAQASVGLAQTTIDKEVVEASLDKQDEHWVKAYWRPAMGWLYMTICFMDFVGFPLITMFLPVFFKGIGIQMQYTAWQSLTLSNGGLIHLAFGAILGVTSFMRGQEKLAKMSN
jgi:Holin of 3TMs, for gene-transfer release